MSDRFLEWAAEIIKLSNLLNSTYEGRHIFGQLFRSGSSCGANYAESHAAQSTKDFIHKRELVLKELRESRFWLQLIVKANLIDGDNALMISLKKENEELIKIIAKSVSTTKQKLK
jgi:four helix bundle protein